MKNFLLKASLIILFTVTAFVLKSQDVVNDGKSTKSEFQVYDYNRNALSMILVNYQGSHEKDVLKEFVKLKVPSKFDDHTLSDQYIPNYINDDNKAIQNVLINQRIGNKIISKWYNRQPDGSFNMDLIKQRGIYNATDLNVVNAASSKKGEDLIKDSGEKLLKNSYVLVMSYPTVKTMEEYYNENKTPTKDRKTRGWTGSYKAYLYRLEWNDSIASVFYNNFWVNLNDPLTLKQERKAQFDKQTYSLSFVSSSTGFINMSLLINDNSLDDDQLLSLMLDDGINQAEYDLSSKAESLKVETGVFAIHPISAKIGSKEGLRVNDRYFVFENVQTSDNEIKSKRKAVVRVKHVEDNEYAASGNSSEVSTFYQIAGHRVQSGMLLEQNNDKRLGLSLFYYKGSDLAKPAGYNFEFEYLPSVSPGVKGKIGLAFDKQDSYSWNPNSYSFEKNDGIFTRAYLGLCKSMYFARHFQFEPSFNMGFESSSEIEEDGLGAYYLEPNIRFGMNLHYNIQLIAGVGYYYFLYVTDVKFKKPIGSQYTDLLWTDIFPGRNGASLNFGLRVQF